MKKIILVLTIALLLISCSSDSSSSSSGLYKWSFKLNGVLYQWEGNHLTGGGAIAAGGQATYSVRAIALQKTNSSGTPIITVSIMFPTASTGNFTFNSYSTTQGLSIMFTNDAQQMTEMYTTGSGATMNVTISSLSNTTFSSNPTNPGKVIGTFSGTVKSATGTTTATITEGTFEAVRGA